MFITFIRSISLYFLVFHTTSWPHHLSPDPHLAHLLCWPGSDRILELEGDLREWEQPQQISYVCIQDFKFIHSYIWDTINSKIQDTQSTRALPKVDSYVWEVHINVRIYQGPYGKVFVRALGKLLFHLSSYITHPKKVAAKQETCNNEANIIYTIKTTRFYSSCLEGATRLCPQWFSWFINPIN